jgi:sulfate-transporting ATPase
VSTALQFALIGAGTGALYSLAALGVLITYRASGTLNFAQGAIGMAGAMICYDLLLTYQLPALLCLAIGVLVGAVLGVASQQLVLKPLQHVSALSKVIATLALLVAIQYGLAIRYGVNLRIVASMLPQGVIEPMPGARVPIDHMYLLGLAAALTAVLAMFYRFTRFGLRTTAVAENQQAVAALRQSPDTIAAMNWGIAGGLAAAVAILIAPILGLDINGLSLIVLPAIAAALLGGFSSFATTFAAGVLIGVCQSELTWYVPVAGVAESVPFLGIVGIVIFRGSSLPLRSDLIDRLPELGSRLPDWRKVVPGLALLTVLIAFISTDWVDALTTSLLFGTILLSFVVLTGFTGQLSLAQFVLAGVGGWIATTLVAYHGVPFELALIIGVAGTVALGLVVGLPALRTRGVNLAVVTIGLAVVIQDVLLTNPNLTGGVYGVTIPDLRIFGIDFSSITQPKRFAVLVAVVLIVLMILVANLGRSALGRILIAVRSNERAAAALGINVSAVKLTAFAISSGIAAIGGILIAYRLTHVDYLDFSLQASILGTLAAMIGGIGYVIGPFFGSTLAPGGVGFHIFAGIPSVENALEAVSGILLVLMLLLNPNGMAQTHNLTHILASRSRKAGQPHTPAQELAPEQTTTVRRVKPGSLEIEGLTVRFGGVTAVENLSLEINSGEIVGLIGPNGAGKTTVVDAVTGYVQPAGGDIKFHGRSLLRMPVHRRAQLGLSRSFQSLELFEDMTVAENLLAATTRRSIGGYITNALFPRQDQLGPAALAAVADFDLAHELRHRPSALPYGRRRLAAIARAVANSPTIVMLDEPAAGLGFDEREELSVLITQLARQWGLGILLIEHDVELVMNVCDRVAVLNFGRLIAHGTPTVVRYQPDVVKAYLGDTHSLDDVIQAL